jgi:hypothetical protein
VKVKHCVYRSVNNTKMNHIPAGVDAIRNKMEKLVGERKVYHSIQGAQLEIQEAGAAEVDISILDKVKEWLRESGVDFYTLHLEDPGKFEIGLLSERGEK